MHEPFNFRQSRIAVTGGAGFIGSAIAKRLLLEDIPEVILISRRGAVPALLEPWRLSGRVRAVACDIRDRNQVSKALAGCDAVFHQAALRVTQSVREPCLAYEIMVDGTFNVVSASADLGVKKIVAASSAIVYGEAVTLPISESHPLQDTTPYGVSKVQNEELLNSYWERFGLNYTVLRYFNVYGPGMTLSGQDVEVLIRWLDCIDAGFRPLIFGDGQQTLDWVFIDDVADANWRALMFPDSGEIFNVCSGTETTLINLLEALCRVANRKVTPEFRAARAVNHVARRFGDPRKAEREMGFHTTVSLEEGLAKLVEWRKRQSSQFRKSFGTAV